MKKIEKLIVRRTLTPMGSSMVVAPYPGELVDKLNELIDAINELALTKNSKES